MKLWTDAFTDNGFMPKRHEFDVADFGAHGDNISPALQWSDLPADTKSLALTVYDPDAPTGSGFWHWVVVNIPVGTQGLAEDAGRADGSGLPAGALQLINDYGTRGFGGAAPPKGASRTATSSSCMRSRSSSCRCRPRRPMRSAAS